MHQSRSQFALKKATQESKALTHTLVTLPPDGGWGWVVLFVCVWDCLCIDGVTLGYSIIQTRLITELKLTELQSSVYISAYGGLVYLCGPITAALANRFGFKKLNFIGGLAGAIFMFSCYWASSFAFLTVCFVCTGIGGSFIYMVLMACPGYWFEEKRSLAFGIVNSASGVACFILPPIVNLVVAVSSWRSVFAFLGGMYFVAFLLSMWIRKPPMMLIEVETPPSTSKKMPAATSMSILNVRGAGRKDVDEKIRQISRHGNLQNHRLEVNRKLSEPSIIFRQPTKVKEFFNKICCKEEDRSVSIERPMYKSDIFFRSQITLDAPSTRNMPAVSIMMSKHKLTSKRDIQQQLDDSWVCCPEAIVRPLADMLSFKLMKNLIYVCILIATFFYYSSIYITYLFFPKTSGETPLGAEVGVVTLQLYGLCMAISRVTMAPIFFAFPEIPYHYFAGGTAVFAGTCQILMCFATSEYQMYLLGCVAGYSLGFWVPMRSLLVVRYIGLEQLTNAMGMLFVVQALGSFFGMPFIQQMRSLTQYVYTPFLFSGLFYILAGLLFLPLDLLHRCVEKE